jgi:hypothetical protein
VEALGYFSCIPEVQSYPGFGYLTEKAVFLDKYYRNLLVQNATFSPLADADLSYEQIHKEANTCI